MNFTDIENYFNNMVAYLKIRALDGNPWVFLHVSCVIEYLANASKEINKTFIPATSTSPAIPKIDAYKGYPSFIINYFPKEYQISYIPSITFYRVDNHSKQATVNDLADAMYFVLRCGMVHNFTLNYDYNNPKNRIILVGHSTRNDFDTHLSIHNFTHSNGITALNAVTLCAENLVDDLEKAIIKLFQEANKPHNAHLKKYIEDYVIEFPPITGLS